MSPFKLNDFLSVVMGGTNILYLFAVQIDHQFQEK